MQDEIGLEIGAHEKFAALVHDNREAFGWMGP
jgi:hypothetical protein